MTKTLDVPKPSQDTSEGGLACGAHVDVWAPHGEPAPVRQCFRDKGHDGPHLSEPDYEGDH